MTQGRYLGLDHGLARIGISISDPLGVLARPLLIVKRTTLVADFAVLTQICNEHEVGQLVVGLPSDSQGGVGAQALTVIRWARKLHTALNLPVIFWDESYSSVTVERSRSQRSRRPSTRRHIDDRAATVMLQDYLDARGGGDEPGYPLAAFEDYL